MSPAARPSRAFQCGAAVLQQLFNCRGAARREDRSAPRPCMAAAPRRAVCMQHTHASPARALAAGPPSEPSALIEPAAAFPSAAAARNRIASILLNVEVVVVGDLLSVLDALLGIEHDALAATSVDDARVAVGLTAMVGESREAAAPRRIHEEVVVDSEDVVVAPAPSAVVRLAHLGYGLAHVLAEILDDEVLLLDRL
eukprot:CAMPEP_0115831260 /NCGR_PEP_ID=MMETSP0287-20121206/2046_1 /TAXON_ID=412157 /ORGANISM="Chrysochromulina rotalis, Strain UIO044" /LENGTH=197 /DNA_ID=CAMNT_0003284599 /DNA_START=212 /DNA_END=802 /DNA_ORIENTATION=+